MEPRGGTIPFEGGVYQGPHPYYPFDSEDPSFSAMRYLVCVLLLLYAPETFGLHPLSLLRINTEYLLAPSEEVFARTLGQWQRLPAILGGLAHPLGRSKFVTMATCDTTSIEDLLQSPECSALVALQRTALDGNLAMPNASTTTSLCEGGCVSRIRTELPKLAGCEPTDSSYSADLLDGMLEMLCSKDAEGSRVNQLIDG